MLNRNDTGTLIGIQKCVLYHATLYVLVKKTGEVTVRKQLGKVTLLDSTVSSLFLRLYVADLPFIVHCVLAHASRISFSSVG